MNIGVIDGQGAGIGQSVIKKIRKETGSSHLIVAMGTNEIGAANMIKAGGDKKLVGEKEICEFLKKESLDCIIGPIGILCSGGINGEVTPFISYHIFNAKCKKYIIPLLKHGIYIPGTKNLQIKDIIEDIVSDIKSMGY